MTCASVSVLHARLTEVVEIVSLYSRMITSACVASADACTSIAAFPDPIITMPIVLFLSSEHSEALVNSLLCDSNILRVQLKADVVPVQFVCN